ncbi:hypothetical protein ALC57_14524 [Trachymyrmex cornetzi]|uniref:DNA-directed DNA polymerase n=1 Tax=Trachymyrmex cornetzi TaxID=471704 RepID=A0A151IYB5_9HYME|nr:hypothetical protein ALC57_14524 [Trachymyrmex cornetzi]
MTRMTPVQYDHLCHLVRPFLRKKSIRKPISINERVAVTLFCLHYFHSNERLQLHIVDCQRINDCAIRLPSNDNKWLSFNNYNRKERVSFVVYADLECILKKTDGDQEASTLTYHHHHQVFSIGYYVRCSYDNSLSKYRFRRDPDCVSWFVEELRSLAHSVKKILIVNVPMETLSSEQRETLHSATHCHVCEKPFAPDDNRVRDHCHLTGRTKEKYVSFTKNVKDTAERSDSRNNIKLRFIDSYKFLSSSLDKLASFLNKNELRILQCEFQNLSEDDFKLLIRKGIFPYEYIDCADKLQDTHLPSRESFYSSLIGDTVSENDCTHAVNVWQQFSVQTLGEYSDLYLKTDVLLLADIFENFRDKCIKSYGLDPAYYYTLPGFTWDSMLKHTRVNFELLTDIDMVMFIERGIRGGLTLVNVPAGTREPITNICSRTIHRNLLRT